MTCAECRDRLDDRLDGLLAPADSAAIEQHLRACPACAREARVYDGLEALLRRSARVPDRVPPAARLVPQRVGPAETLLPRRGPSPVVLARVWIAVAAVLLAFLAALPTLEEQPRRPVPAAAVRTARAQEPPVAVDRKDPRAKLRLAAEASGDRRAPLLAELRGSRAGWERAYVAAIRAGETDAAWLGLAADLGVDAARPALRQLLSETRCGGDALLTLARMRDPVGTAFARAGLNGGTDPEACLEALTVAQPERAAALLLEATRDDALWGAAMRLLSRLGAAADPELLARLGSRDRRAQREAMELASLLGRTEAARGIHPLLSGPLRGDAVDALLSLRNPESVGPLVTAMGDPALADRIAGGLAKFGAGGIARLLDLLRTGTAAQRSRAAAVLGKTGDPAATPALCAQLRDASSRRQAIAALGALGNPAAIPCLEPLLDDPALAREALAAIAAIGGAGAFAPVARAAARHATAREALDALGRLGTEEAFKLLLSGLHRAYTAPAAARNLGRLGDKKAIPALIGVLHRSEVRADAVAALQELTHQDFGANAAAWQTWWKWSEKGSGIERPAIDQG